MEFFSYIIRRNAIAMHNKFCMAVNRFPNVAAVQSTASVDEGLQFNKGRASQTSNIFMNINITSRTIVSALIYTPIDCTFHIPSQIWARLDLFARYLSLNAGICWSYR